MDDINPKKYIYDVIKLKKMVIVNFQFISSWNMNYKSWRVQKKIPIKIIKYEDLLKETYNVVLKILLNL